MGKVSVISMVQWLKTNEAFKWNIKEEVARIRMEKEGKSLIREVKLKGDYG